MQTTVQRGSAPIFNDTISLDIDNERVPVTVVLRDVSKNQQVFTANVSLD